MNYRENTHNFYGMQLNAFIQKLKLSKNFLQRKMVSLLPSGNKEADIRADNMPDNFPYSPVHFSP